MSNLALYRKYRPQVFEDVIGQDHIVKTLISQIKNNNVGHAYLFCGTRGVGKTSIAKIFANALNCQHPNENFSPCLKCPNCIENSKMASVDILEIDAASNNGVDNIRELKEKIQFPPINGHYKVYIIDEVHMLTSGAFNALLKTLEEPPSYAVFILATTESYKVPATILSRCTKFDFKLVSVKELEKLVQKIFNEENIKCSKETITAICKAGEGSVRDTLSICDMLASYCENNITYDKFLECMGTLNTQFIFQTSKAIKQKDVGQILLSVKEISESGKNLSILIKDMMEFYRNCLIVKTLKDYSQILMLPEDIVKLLEEISNMSTEKELLDNLQSLSKLDGELKYALNPRLLCETAFIAMALYSSNIESQQNIDFDAIIEKKVMEMIKLEQIKIPFVQNKVNDNFSNSKNSTINEVEKKKNEIKIEKINENLDIIEKMGDGETIKNKIEPSKPEIKEKAKETLTPVLNSDLNKIVSIFIRKVREAELSFVTITLNDCSYSLEDSNFYIVCPNDFSIETLKGFSKKIENILSEINPALKLQVVLDDKKLKTDKLVNSLKGKFGDILNLKD